MICGRAPHLVVEGGVGADPEGVDGAVVGCESHVLVQTQDLVVIQGPAGEERGMCLLPAGVGSPPLYPPLRIPLRRLPPTHPSHSCNRLPLTPLT